MAKGFFLKTAQSGNWSTVTQMFVKTGAAWESVKNAWIKVSSTTWALFYSAATKPSSDVEILQSYYGQNSDSIRFQGKNYAWSPAPSSLKYYFKYIDNSSPAVTTYLNASGSSGDTATNPSTYNIYPSSTTYISIDPNGSNYVMGGTGNYVFEVRAINPDSTSTSVPFSLTTPKAPTLTVTSLSSTSLNVNIAAASTADYNATGRYIVYTYDSNSGYIDSGGGRGGYAVSTSDVVLTGLTSGRQYTVYVLPVTGYVGTNRNPYNSSTNTGGYSGYPGLTASATGTPDAGYTFIFGNNLYVSTNGYIGLDTAGSSDSIPSSGKFLGILPADLRQASSNSVWYWSDSSKFVVRWEGWTYDTSSQTKIYQATFYDNQNYADVLAITVASPVAGTSAFVQNGTVKSTYASGLTTGSSYRVYLDGSPVSAVSVSEVSKSIMKQVGGLTSGTTDQGYTTITTSANQVNFTAGTIYVSGGSTTTADGKVSSGASLTVNANNDWPSGTTFSYQWKRTRDINGLPPVNSGTGSTQSVSTTGEYYYCVVSYSDSSNTVSGTLTTYYYLVAPAAPSYTLTNNSNGTFTISSVTTTGGNYYYGTWKLGSGSNNTISRTSSSTNSTITSGTGSVSVRLYGSSTVYYQGDTVGTQIDGWEYTDSSVSVTTATLTTGTKRSLNTGVTFTNTSTTMYVSTNGYIAYGNNTPGSISIPTSGNVLNIFGPNDLSQTNTSGTTQNVTYKNGSSYFAVHWIGRYLGSTTETLEYEARFYWNSDLVEVYAITNNLSSSHTQSDNAFYANGSATRTWGSNSSSISSWTLESGMGSAGAPTASDDGYTSITATKPVIKGSGTKRTIPLGVTVTSGSTIAYVSTNGFIGIGSDPGTAISIPGSGRYLNILQGDLKQTALYTSATSTTYNIRYQGTQLSDTNQTVDYEVKFTFGSSNAEVYIITNNLTATADDNTIYVNGSGSSPWSTASTSTMTASASTSNTTNNGVDDARTAITLTASGGGGGGGSTTGATSITYVAPTTTAVNTTTFTGGGIDDGYFTFTLPFTTYFNGTAYSSISVGTNSYVTFGNSSTAYSGLGASNPPYDKIMVDAADRGSTGVYWTSSSSSWTMRYEGSSGTSGSPIAIIWEITASSSNNKRIRLSIKQVAGGGTTGMFSSSSSISSLGGASTSWNIDSA